MILSALLNICFASSDLRHRHANMWFGGGLPGEKEQNLRRKLRTTGLSTRSCDIVCFGRLVLEG